MAEYLVIADDHWTHKVPESERENWSPTMWETFYKAKEKGDVIAVYEDGTLGENVNPKFRAIKVPGESVDTHRQSIYADEDISEEQPGKMIMKRRFNIDVDALIPVGKTVEALTQEQFASRMYDKKALMEGI